MVLTVANLFQKTKITKILTPIERFRKCLEMVDLFLHKFYFTRDPAVKLTPKASFGIFVCLSQISSVLYTVAAYDIVIGLQSLMLLAFGVQVFGFRHSVIYLNFWNLSRRRA